MYTRGTGSGAKLSKNTSAHHRASKILIHHTAERDHPTSKVLENNERPRYVEDESTNYLGKKNKQQMIIDKINIIITSH